MGQHVPLDSLTTSAISLDCQPGRLAIRCRFAHRVRRIWRRRVFCRGSSCAHGQAVWACRGKFSTTTRTPRTHSRRLSSPRERPIRSDANRWPGGFAKSRTEVALNAYKAAAAGEPRPTNGSANTRRPQRPRLRQQTNYRPPFEKNWLPYPNGSGWAAGGAFYLDGKSQVEIAELLGRHRPLHPQSTRQRISRGAARTFGQPRCGGHDRRAGGRSWERAGGFSPCRPRSSRSQLRPHWRWPMARRLQRRPLSSPRRVTAAAWSSRFKVLVFLTLALGHRGRCGGPSVISRCATGGTSAWPSSFRQGRGTASRPVR